jgi:hypothetical protein
VYVSLNYPDTDYNHYYSFVVDIGKLDTLTNLINSLPSKLEKNYEASTADHPISFSFIIELEEDTILTSYFGDCMEKELEPVFYLSKYLNSLTDKSTKSLDSLCVFKTKSRLILPPPPPF